jgi:hypothetical protein
MRGVPHRGEENTPGDHGSDDDAVHLVPQAGRGLSDGFSVRGIDQDAAVARSVISDAPLHGPSAVPGDRAMYFMHDAEHLK